jgi:sortase A
MLRMLSYSFIVGGLLVTGFGGYQYFQSEVSVNQSMKEAKAVLNESSINVTKTVHDDDETEFSPEEEEVVGILSIPGIKLETPIIEGTDPDELEKGVGHYATSAYPTQNDQIVLSGHRDTVFRKMKDVQIGDIITLKLPYGEFSYKIKDTKIVDADDRTVIKSTAPNEVLVLSTCYPFNFVGNAPERFVVTAVPINSIIQ